MKYLLRHQLSVKVTEQSFFGSLFRTYINFIGGMRGFKIGLKKDNSTLVVQYVTCTKSPLFPNKLDSGLCLSGVRTCCLRLLGAPVTHLTAFLSVLQLFFFCCQYLLRIMFRTAHTSTEQAISYLEECTGKGHFILQMAWHWSLAWRCWKQSSRRGHFSRNLKRLH